MAGTRWLWADPIPARLWCQSSQEKGVHLIWSETCERPRNDVPGGDQVFGVEPGRDSVIENTWRKRVGVETASTRQTKDLTEHGQQSKST